MVRAEEGEESTLLERGDRQTVSGVETVVVPETIEERVIARWHLRRPLLVIERIDQHVGEQVADGRDVFLTELKARAALRLGFGEARGMVESHPRGSPSGEIGRSRAGRAARGKHRRSRASSAARITAGSEVARIGSGSDAGPCEMTRCRSICGTSHP